MAAVLSAEDQQRMVNSFLEIAEGQRAQTARQFLRATGWNLENAIQLFYISNDGGSEAVSTSSEDDLSWEDSTTTSGERMGSWLPYEIPFADHYHNFEEEIQRHRGVEAEQGASPSATSNSQDELASLYRPPFALMFHGNFHEAKKCATRLNKWLLVNLQSTTEFRSLMLNHDTWGDEALAQTIKAHFVFWQVYDDTEEGSKVCTFYKLDSMPATLLLDPITGQMLLSWTGLVGPEILLKALSTYIRSNPLDNHSDLSNKRRRERQARDDTNTDELQEAALVASMENLETDENEKPEKRVAYLPLPEEPNGDKHDVCKIGLRFPDGRRVQRSFLRTDPVQLLWSFCHSQLKESDYKPFRLIKAVPGASTTLDYDVESTLDESELDNTMVSVAWE